MPGKTLAAIVGFPHRTKALGFDVEAHVRRLPDGSPLLLVREPDNKYDPFAVQVWAGDLHVGYIKGTQVRPVAMAMDAGRIGVLSARRAEEATPGPEPRQPEPFPVNSRCPAKLSTRNGERYPFVEIDL